MEIQCKNCNGKFNETYHYCPYCGQKSATTRIDLKQLLWDTWVALTDTNKGFLRLVIDLCAKPGLVALDYISGRRRKYFNPVSFLLLAVALAMFIILKFVNPALSALEPTSLSNYYSGGDERLLLEYSLRNFNIFILLMCPINGLLIWFLFKKNGRNYAENTVLAAYLSGQTMLFYCIILIPLIFFTGMIPILGIVSGLLLSIWYVIGIIQFHDARNLKGVLKAILVILISQFVGQQLIFLSFELQKIYT